MSANVEKMFYVNKDLEGKRFAPWHGLGTPVNEALSSAEAITMAGLDWKVVQKKVYTEGNVPVPGYYANVRETDNHVLGMVTNRYRIVQNAEAFEFTDSLIGEGVKYVTAGSLAGGKRVWMLALLPDVYKVMGEKVDPYLVFTNSHDGMGAIKVAMTPVRVVCQNTLNLALNSADRSWSTAHKGDMESKLSEARETLQLADTYMKELNKASEELAKKKISLPTVDELINCLLPIDDAATDRTKKNVQDQRDGIRYRYFAMPDLQDLDHTGYRFVNAVSDFATHSDPIRKTENYQKNLFGRTLNGNALIDKAYDLVLAR